MPMEMQLSAEQLLRNIGNEELNNAMLYADAHWQNRHDRYRIQIARVDSIFGESLPKELRTELAKFATAAAEFRDVWVVHFECRYLPRTCGTVGCRGHPVGTVSVDPWDRCMIPRCMRKRTAWAMTLVDLAQSVPGVPVPDGFFMEWDMGADRKFTKARWASVSEIWQARAE